MKEETILYDGNAFVEELGDVKFTITNQKIILEKEKGLFRKKVKPVDTISIKDIKLYKDKAYVKQRKNTIYIETTHKSITVTFHGLLEAKKVCGKLNDLRTGTNAIDRGTKKVDKIVKNVGKVAVSVAGVAIVAKEIYDHASGKK